MEIFVHEAVKEISLYENSGSYCFSASEFMDGRFEGGLFLPNSDWILTQAIAIEKFRTINKSQLDGRSIFIAPVKNETLDWVYTQYLIICSSIPIDKQARAIDECLSVPVIEMLLQDMSGYLDVSSLSVCKSILYFSFQNLLPDISVAQKTSSTRDSRSKHQVRGLHVDNWETPRELVSNRSISGYKYIVNLGMEERFFTFIDCSIQDIFESTPQSDFGSFKDLIINSSFASPIADWFLSQNPCYPVRKVSLMPGMGILAPVQNMIHDGDLSTKKLPDLVGMISFNSIKYQTHASPPNKSMQQTANAAAD